MAVRSASVSNNFSLNWDAIAPSQPVEERAPSVQKRLEDFYYTSTYRVIALNGPPHQPYVYKNILDICLHQDKVGVTASTDDGVVQDLWRIGWEDRKPVLEFQERLAHGENTAVHHPNAISTQCGNDRLAVSKKGDECRITLSRQHQKAKIIIFDYGVPTQVALNSKWAVVSWQDGKVTVIGETMAAEFKAEATVRCMLLDDENGLLTFSDRGLIELWNLPDFVRSDKIGHFNQSRLFRNPFSRDPMDTDDYEQVAGTMNGAGQLSFIARERCGKRIRLHTSRPLPLELMDTRKNWPLPKENVPMQAMSSPLANALFPINSKNVQNLEREVHELRATLVKVQSEQQLANSRVVEMQGQIAEKARLEQDFSNKLTEERQRTEQAEKARNEQAAEKGRLEQDFSNKLREERQRTQQIEKERFIRLIGTFVREGDKAAA